MGDVSFYVCLVLTVKYFQIRWLDISPINPPRQHDDDNDLWTNQTSSSLIRTRKWRKTGERVFLDCSRWSVTLSIIFEFCCNYDLLFTLSYFWLLYSPLVVCAQFWLNSILTFSSSVDDWIYFLTHSAETRLVCHVTYTMQHVVYRLYRNTRIGVRALVCIYVLLVSVVSWRLHRRFAYFFFT